MATANKLTLNDVIDRVSKGKAGLSEPQIDAVSNILGRGRRQRTQQLIHEKLTDLKPVGCYDIFRYIQLTDSEPYATASAPQDWTSARSLMVKRLLE